MDKQRRKQILGRVAVWAFDQVHKLFLTRDVAVAERRGARLGMLMYRFDKKHRERTYANLKMAFPDWTEDRYKEVAEGVFRHYGRVMGDFLRTPMRTVEELTNGTEVHGMENFERAESLGKGVIFVTGHIGNFERFGHYCTSRGVKLTVVARDANQSEMQERIGSLRAKAGMEVVSRGEAARPIMSKLRKKEVIGILPDQNAGEAFVPFFGHLCGTVLGPAVIHQRTGAPIVPAYCVRTGVGQYRVLIQEPIDFENVEKDATALMAAINASLESVIRDYPEQWLWMHDRWKSARQRGLI